ncbi:MAG: CIC family chloride channel protein [Acidimicrobiales bacterium]|jgi:CIC family chloride channel protein
MKRNLERFLPEAKGAQLTGASVGLGILVGLVVAAFDYITLDVFFHRLVELPLWAQAIAPMVGLAISALVLRFVGGGITGSTSDEYISAYHARSPNLPWRPLPARLMAGVATIGMGGALGVEGPSIYAGSTIGVQLSRRLERWLGRDAVKLLLTAGAAAGVAAVFQAPATGVIFALEAPYRDDLAHRALLPALFASASSYLTFISMPFIQPEALLDQAWSIGLGAGDLVAALAIGVGAGVGGRAFAHFVRRAKLIAKSTATHWLVLGGGLLLGSLAIVSDRLYGEPLTLGPGVNTVEWLLEERSFQLVALLFGFRFMATLVTVGSGGVGGLFIPLAVQGVLLGRLVGVGLEEVGINPESVRLLPILGLAAFLAAGYRTPIAAVMFVAESTGNSGSAVVPALIAAAVSQLVAGRHSVSAGQQVERLGHLEGRFTLPVTAALTTDVLTVPPDATVSEFVWVHALGRRQTVVPVVDGDRYVGLCKVEDCSQIDRDAWEHTTVADVTSTDLPTATPSWTLRDVVAAMEDGHSDIIAVTDRDGIFIGVVIEAEIVKLGEILDETEGSQSSS